MSKLVPQPQLLLASGFKILNWLPISSCSKSTVDPLSSARLASSTTTRAPLSRSVNTTSWAGSVVLDSEMVYWKPWQPPDSTSNRSAWLEVVSGAGLGEVEAGVGGEGGEEGEEGEEDKDEGVGEEEPMAERRAMARGVRWIRISPPVSGSRRGFVMCRL